ncbi:MAG: ATP-dependent DNA helicase RecG, partial [Myxococcota bacterium]
MAGSALPAAEVLRRVLLPPLRFAAGNDFAGLHRLRGFGDLVTRTLQSVGEETAPVCVELRAMARDFDEVSVEERRARVLRALTLLDGLADGTQKSSTTTGTKLSDNQTKRTPPPPLQNTDVVAVTKPRRRPSTRDSQSPTPSPVIGASDDVMLWPVTRVRGVGPQRAETFAARALHTVGDLLAVLPRAYEDRRQVTDLGTVQAGSIAVVSGEILASAQIGGGRGKRWEVLLDDGRGRLKLVFFRYGLAQMKQRFLPGATVTATGEVQRYGGVVQMVHPRVVPGAQTDALRGIWPVYPELGGLPPPELARAIRGALDVVMAAAPTDPLPQTIRAQAAVLPLQEALVEIHTPQAEMSAAAFKALCEHTAPAYRRLAFEELFALSLAMALRRRLGAREPATIVDGARTPEELAAELLPFPLTGAQRRTAQEILRDMARDEPMARLLQGDVGAGKTAVAALALLQVAHGGMQGTLMAPTELLAEQHRRTLSRWFQPLGFEVELITGSMRAKARRDAVHRLASGASKIAVGTHALLSDDVRFERLAVCVIDEQHRFGVAQRASLKEKGPIDEEGRSLAPHLLVMTATPIPRSLALTLYGDLAVSVLDELPPGRTPVKTRVLDGRGRAKAWDAIA